MEAYCVIYRDLRRDPPAMKLSRSYAELSLAGEAASALSRQGCVPLAIRSSEGEVITKDKLDHLLESCSGKSA